MATSEKKEPHVVVTIEAAFPVNSFDDWKNSFENALEELRQHGAARPISFKELDHDPFDDKEWREGMIYSITVNHPITLDLPD